MDKPRPEQPKPPARPGRPKSPLEAVRLQLRFDAETARRVRALDRAALAELLRRAVNGYVPPPPSPTPARSREGTVLVAPREPLTRAVARLEAQGRTSRVYLPERHEAFRELLRFRLRHEWDGGCWRRDVPESRGPMRERLVEIAHRVVQAGFILEFPAELIEDVLSANYTPEPERWVLAGRGKRAGWLVFDWPRGEDHYGALSAIRGAEYDGELKRLCARPEHYEEVEDAARALGFALTPQARALLEEAKARLAGALVVGALPEPAPAGPARGGAEGQEDVYASLLDDD